MIIKCLTLVEAFIDITIYDNSVFNSNRETNARPVFGRMACERQSNRENKISDRPPELE
jgi:hypothetical protein